MTYPLGWSVITQTIIRRERWPDGRKVKATPLVQPGQDVLPDQPLIRFEHRFERKRPGEALRPAEPPSLLTAGTRTDPQESRRDTGDTSDPGVASEVIIAGLAGRVVEVTPRGGVVIESRAAVVQGTLGAGGQVAGVLTIWQPSSPGRAPQVIPPCAILVVPGPLNFTLLRQAANSGVAGIVASSIALRDLEGFLRTDLISLIDCEDIERAQEHQPAFTLLLTEGLGVATMPARILNLLSHYQGSVVLLSGTTAVRQGSFPELVISLPTAETQQDWQPVQVDPDLTLGAQVRVCGGDREGSIGTIDYLFTYEQVFASGIRARAGRLRLEDGSLLVIPLALVERIG